MNRCLADVLHHRGDLKVRERTLEEQLEAQPLTVDDLLQEVGSRLFNLGEPRELRAVASGYTARLTERQFSRFVNLMVDCYGTPFARQAGLPVGRPRLRAVVAGGAR